MDREPSVLAAVQRAVLRLVQNTAGRRADGYGRFGVIVAPEDDVDDVTAGFGAEGDVIEDDVHVAAGSDV